MNSGFFSYIMGFAAGAFSGWWIWGRALRDLIKLIKQSDRFKELIKEDKENNKTE